MPLSENAIENDQSYPVRVEVNKVHYDEDFNCREHIVYSDCIDLVKSISENGLLQPIVVRPLRTESRTGRPAETDLIEKGFTHFLIAGHRRLIAYKLLEAPEIPCVLRDAYIDNFQAHDLNAIENIQRQELSFYEEAMAIKHYKDYDWKHEEVGQRINRSVGWVKVRYQLLDMPDAILPMAHNGHIRPSDVRDLYKYRNDEHELLQMAGKVREKRREDATMTGLEKLQRKPNKTQKKFRGKAEVLALQDIFRDLCSQINREGGTTYGRIFTEQGNSISTRLLAWCAGEINNLEVHESIKQFALTVGVDYEIPEMRDE